MKRLSLFSFWPRLGGRRASFKVGVIATLAIAVGANIAVLGNLGVLFGQPIPGAAHQNLYEPHFKALNFKAMPAAEVGIFRPVYDCLAASLDGRADTALYEIRFGMVGKAANKALSVYMSTTPSLAGVLGVHVVAGRSLRDSDTAAGAEPVTVVPAKLAMARFGSFDAALNHELVINGKSYRIVGVLPPALEFPSKFLSDRYLQGHMVQAWIPFTPEAPGAVSELDFGMFAIVRPGPTLTESELMAAFDRAFREALPVYTPEAKARIKAIQLVQQVSSVSSRMYGSVITRLQLLELAALLLIVLVFINLAGLATSDALSRRHELATRLALGASRRQLYLARFRRLFVLGLIGWLIGIGLGLVGQRALAASIGQAGSAVALSVQVLVLTLVSVVVIVALISAIGFFRAGRPRQLLADLMSGGRATGNRKLVYAMRSLISLQLAASIVLLILAGHFYVNVFSLTHNNLGFEPDQRSFFNVLMPGTFEQGSSSQHKEFPEWAGSLDERLLVELNNRADIKSAALLSSTPFSGSASTTSAGIAPESKAAHTTINRQLISRHFAKTMGLKVLAGNPGDIFAGAGHAIFIDARAAEKLWPGVNPSKIVGRSLYVDMGYNGPYRVTAVVAPLRMKSYGSIGGTLFKAFSGSVFINPQRFVVNSSLPPNILRKEIAQAIHRVNPKAKLMEFHSAQSVVAKAYAGRTQLGRVFGVLAVVALLIAAIGLFALLAYRSLMRRPEFAIRGALGATPGRLLCNVLGEAGTLWLIGCLIGVPAAYGLSIVLASYLPKLGLPAIWVTVAVVVALGITALIAALIPARRAAGTDLSGNLSV